MEFNIDKYSHKLSVKNNISYEIARDIIEKNIDKLENQFPHSNDIVKKAYTYSKKLTGGDTLTGGNTLTKGDTLTGGNKKYVFKINYNNNL